MPNKNEGLDQFFTAFDCKVDDFSVIFAGQEGNKAARIQAPSRN